MSFRRFLAVLLLVILLGILQNTNFLTLAGVKPNFLLAVLIAVSFFIEETAMYILLVLLAAIFLKFAAFLELETAAFVLSALAAGLIGRRLRWLPIFNNLVLVAGATVIFYLLTEPSYLIGNPGVVGIELVYNLALSVVFFNLFNLWPTNSMLKT